MSPDESEELMREARHFVRRHLFDEATVIYRRLILQDTDSVPAHEGLAIARFAAGDYQQAVTAFTRLTQLEPLEARHYVNLGAVHNRAGEFSKAVDALRKAIQRDRRQADAYYNLGIAYRKQKQLNLAVSAYKEAIRLNPQMAEAFQNLGNVYLEMNNYPLAIANFQKSLDIDPEFEKARSGLQKAQELLRQSKEAASPLARATSADAAALRLAACDQRVLSEAERTLDRGTVSRLTNEMIDLVDDCTRFLHSQLEPAVLDLQRTVAEGDRSSLHYAKATERFADTFTSWTQLKESLSRRFALLYAHEQRVGSPEGLSGPPRPPQQN